MPNHLKSETSPYLLQHAENPVNWYPWGDTAFRRAREEDKPVFLSIGYSTCHWCHVMAHESFEDQEIAELLNRYFISIKVDKEERPDIDSIYMAACQAFTGSGGWPTSIFMTAEQKPFFAGTYFPKTTRGGMIGLRELLLTIHERWETSRNTLLRQADQIVKQLNEHPTPARSASLPLTELAVEQYKRSFDRKHGGFGDAPKFPTPHNYLFLLAYYERHKDADCLLMAEQSLLQMYRGGMFDHIGYGFSRYSTDRKFLVPHFEKMLYDNALLILACCKAHEISKKDIYRDIAEKTADYILREMSSQDGGFYSAQDADSDGEEGKHYLFTPEEILGLLGQQDGEAFNRHFDISPSGNFEGKSIPNLLKSATDRSFDRFMPQLRKYRKDRTPLHLDDKILCSWNGLMIAAMCRLYRLTGNPAYLTAARNADRFIRENMYDKGRLFVSWREGTRGENGFLDDYAGYAFAQLALYEASLDQTHLRLAQQLCDRVLASFSDPENGGFYLYGTDNEELIVRLKETYDGALPSGNSLMAWNLVRLASLTENGKLEKEAQRQLEFLASHAAGYPAGHAMFLLALLEHEEPLLKVTVVSERSEELADLPLRIPPDAVILMREPSRDLPLKEGKTTFYVCRNHICLPPVNELSEQIR